MTLRASFLLQYLSLSPVGIKNERRNRTWASCTPTVNSAVHPYRNQIEWILYVVRICNKLHKDRYLKGMRDVKCEV
jgi:hypothetical protein